MSVVVKSAVRIGSKLREKMRVTLYALGVSCGEDVDSVREKRWVAFVRSVGCAL